MAGKLIALESTNQQLLDKTAKYLALALQSEGKAVEVLSFPQAKQSSGHFAESHQKGEYGQVNPYAASMFYILDRYDASPQIRQYLEQDTIVICKSYRGSSLAKLGASIADAGVRKGFYIWADSLESGTFGVPRPDMAIVLSEELPTLYELCELFPKDYVFAVDPTKVRNILNKLVPPMPAVSKRVPGSKTTWLQALVEAGQGTPFDFEATKYYATLPKKSKNHTLYADGLHELEVLREKAVTKLPKQHRAAAKAFLTPVGLVGLAKAERQPEQPYNNKIFDALLDEGFKSNYGDQSQSAKIMQISPRNELDNLALLLAPKTEFGIDDIGASLQKMPIQKRIELYKAYLAGADNSPALYPLTSTYTTVVVRLSYADLLQMSNSTRFMRFALQQPSPRWGYTVPDEYADAIDEIEDCFASSLKLHSQLELKGEYETAGNCVLQGHFVQAVMHLTGDDIRLLAKSGAKYQSDGCIRLIEQLNETFPILTT